MRYAIPITLWTLVLIFGIGYFLVPGLRGVSPPVEGGGVAKSQVPSGTVIESIPWKNLPHVDPFKLKDQNGNTFDTSELIGKPYVVSFFFASCPTFCRDLNKEIDRVNRALKHTDIQFLTISVDPEKDTVDVLDRYAQEFGATPDRWAFLTGQMYKIKEVGEHMFNVIVNKDTHTDSILLVDKWGRYRDRFKWDQPMDMQRFIKVAKEVAKETEPPLTESFETRNVLAGFDYPDLVNVPWIRDFHLTERSGKKFFSRQLTGEVWIANFFFSSCPGICKSQNEYLRDLQKRLGERSPPVISITTDSVNDTPDRLKKYAKTFDADEDKWLFLTGGSHLIKRIGSEFFKAHASDDHHSSQLFAVDRWGKVRGDFDWQEASQEIEMLKLIEKLRAEDRPQRPSNQKRKRAEESAAEETDDSTVVESNAGGEK